MANDLTLSFEQWLSSRLFIVSPGAQRQPGMIECQVDAVCGVVRDRLEADPETSAAELEALATAAGKAIAAGVVALGAPHGRQESEQTMATELAAIHQLLRREFDARRAAAGPIERLGEPGQ